MPATSSSTSPKFLNLSCLSLRLIPSPFKTVSTSLHAVTLSCRMRQYDFYIIRRSSLHRSGCGTSKSVFTLDRNSTS
nr:MAG TPA: hypothetical protein [Bacteriophage sp.]DAR79390.1 MAG TPA: hypothetical protein [Caudoviricetes sp.]